MINYDRVLNYSRADDELLWHQETRSAKVFILQPFEVNLEYQIPIFLVTATVTESVRSPVKLREWECQLNVTNIMLLNNNSNNNSTSTRYNETGKSLKFGSRNYKYICVPEVRTLHKAHHILQADVELLIGKKCVTEAL